MLAELRVTPAGSQTSFARLIADLGPILSDSSGWSARADERLRTPRASERP
jgi:hypothetical protein